MSASETTQPSLSVRTTCQVKHKRSHDDQLDPDLRSDLLMDNFDAVSAVSEISTMVSRDPYLDFQPAFSYSLPIQLFVGGITLTLLAVLLMHLLCESSMPPRGLDTSPHWLTSVTTQYHYPLAPLNYCLQLSSIVTVFLSVLVKMWFVLDYSAHSADQWPYDLDYIAVSIPPKSWTVAQDAAWFFLQALNIGLSNVRLQFLYIVAATDDRSPISNSSPFSTRRGRKPA